MSIPVFGYAPCLSCTHEAIHQHGDEAVEMRHVGYVEPSEPGRSATLIFDCSGCDAQVTVRTTHTFPGIKLQPAS